VIGECLKGASKDVTSKVMVLWVFLENLFLNIFSYLIQNTWMRVRLRRHFAFGPIIEYFVNKFIWNIFVKKEVSGVFRHEWLNDKIWNSRSGQKKKLLEFKKPMNFMEFFDFSLWGVWAKAWSINTTPPGQLFWAFSLFSPRWVWKTSMSKYAQNYYSHARVSHAS